MKRLLSFCPCFPPFTCSLCRAGDWMQKEQRGSEMNEVWSEKLVMSDVCGGVWRSLLLLCYVSSTGLCWKLIFAGLRALNPYSEKLFSSLCSWKTVQMKESLNSIFFIPTENQETAYSLLLKHLETTALCTIQCCCLILERITLMASFII